MQRDGRTVAAVQLAPAEDDTWWIESFAACRETGIKLDWPPPPVPEDMPDVAELRCDGEQVELVTPFV